MKRSHRGWTVAGPANHRDGRGIPRSLLLHVMQTNYMFTFFLTWVREGRYHPFIRMPRTCKKVRSQTSPLGREQGRKEVNR